ncbi:hypothetical protein POPTR_001G144933v4 [Populus trichocarpa]|uniref:Vacuolar protein sorting 55 family protein n=1 Tax=Populus trichocarpa TaxID=3694 RepID=A0A3N7E9U2_POPTR|nr:hypothetical protein POPTR_001G144933v4 [Populus trichocarpa]
MGRVVSSVQSSVNPVQKCFNSSSFLCPMNTNDENGVGLLVDDFHGINKCVCCNMVVAEESKSVVLCEQYALPPGDIGWPLIGNTWSFLISFKYGSPDSFISSFVTRSPLFPSLIFHELT